MRDDELAADVEADFETAAISDRRKAMLRYAVKLTREPSSVTEEDIQSLRDVGLGDRDILHLVEVVSYYAYANRIADGLGIPLEDWIEE